MENLLVQLRDQLDLAILALQENKELRRDRDEWKEKYTNLLNETIKHNDIVTANMLKLALKGVKE